MPMLKIIMICHIKIPHHEGFFVFHNLCSWALSLITTDRINLRNQHCIFFPLWSGSVHHLLLRLLTLNKRFTQSG